MATYGGSSSSGSQQRPEDMSVEPANLKRERSPEAEAEAEMEEALVRIRYEVADADHQADLPQDILQAMFGPAVCSLNTHGPPWHDDVTRKELSQRLVEAGMEGERKNLRDFRVYKPATWADWKRLGGRAVPSRWVLRQRGEGSRPG